MVIRSGCSTDLENFLGPYRVDFQLFEVISRVNGLIRFLRNASNFALLIAF